MTPNRISAAKFYGYVEKSKESSIFGASRKLTDFCKMIATDEVKYNMKKLCLITVALSIFNIFYANISTGIVCVVALLTPAQRAMLLNIL